jgi:hypothetical protein
MKTIGLSLMLVCLVLIVMLVHSVPFSDSLKNILYISIFGFAGAFLYLAIRESM